MPGPEFAIASRYGLVKARSGWNSSANRYPGPPVPRPSGSPPWIMKFSITRWKTVPSYSGPLDFTPVAGCVHSLVPSASPTKFATVFGAWFGKSLITMSPRLVLRVANSSSATSCLPVYT